ncbi:MAG: AMP-binding protein [Gammaproteobacteria bacterium]|nr:AMP-binding protein [Gammaproteobacteria bacterium]
MANSDRDASLRACDTFPKLLLRNAERFAHQPAFREKDLGIWQTWTWAETAQEVRAFSMGLKALGLERGDKVAVIGSNRPQLYWTFDAVEAMGAIPVPLYADGVAQEMKFVLHHAGVRFAICEDQEQIDKVLSIKDELPSLEIMIFEDSRGMRHYQQEFLHEYAATQARGREHDRANPELYLDEIAKASGDDIASIMYTSGTTGNPKGVMLRHRNIIESAAHLVQVDHMTDKEDILAYLPLAWVGDQIYSMGEGHVAGFTVNCPESSDTVLIDLRDIGPTAFFSPPAIFENFLTQIQIRMEDALMIKQKLYAYFIKVAQRCGVQVLEGGEVPFKDRLLYRLGEFLIYGPLKNNLGLSRVRLAYTGGAPLGEEVFNFYRSIGINLKQLYAQTESSAYCTVQRDGDVRLDTVGPAGPGVDIRIEEGEIQVKSPGCFLGYYKNDEATRETLTQDGWIRTGDAGYLDDAGHLKVIDRAKDVGTMTDGTLFAPQFVENKLKFFPFVREAVAHGDSRDNVTMFVVIELEAVGNWAERKGLAYSNFMDLAGLDEVYGLVRECIEQVNQGLAQDSAMASAQVTRFLLLHKELDADDGELTRTRKVRRRLIAERYKALINALYSDADNVDIESEVVFEDGRKSTMRARLKIGEAKTFSPDELRRAA